MVRCLSKSTNPRPLSLPYDSAATALSLPAAPAWSFLEELEHARRRGARIYVIVGDGATSDGYTWSLPRVKAPNAA